MPTIEVHKNAKLSLDPSGDGLLLSIRTSSSQGDAALDLEQSIALARAIADGTGTVPVGDKTIVISSGEERMDLQILRPTGFARIVLYGEQRDELIAALNRAGSKIVAAAEKRAALERETVAEKKQADAATVEEPAIEQHHRGSRAHR